MLSVMSSGALIAQDDIRAEREKLLKERDEIVAQMQKASDDGDHEGYNSLNSKLEQLGASITKLGDLIKAEVAEKNQAAKAVMLYNDGTKNLKAGRYQDAINKYNESLEIDPQNAQAYYNMGFAYLRLRNPADASKAFQKALDYNANYADAHSALGNIAAKQRDNAKALDHFSQAIALDSMQYKAWYGIGNIHLKSRRWKEAENHYGKAVEIKDDYAAAWVALGRALSEQPGKSTAAIEALQKGVKKDSRLYNGYYHLSSVYNKIKSYSKALESAEKCLSIKKNYYPAWNEKGIALMNKGRKKEAIAAFEKSKEGGSQWRKLAEYYIKKVKGEIQ